MSSLAARAELTRAISQVIPNGWSIRDVSNVRVDVPPNEKIFTILFQSGTALPVTLGMPCRMREQGTAVVTLFTPAGTGEDDPLLAAEIIAGDLPYAVQDPYLSITEISPPFMQDNSDHVGLFAATSVSISYTYDYTR